MGLEHKGAERPRMAAPGSHMGARAVFLVGFMAAGKSSVGRELARRLDWQFVDLDACIEAREQNSIAGIFRDRGEAAFRRVETAALEHLIATLSSDTVVALGGGTFIQQNNRDLLHGYSSVFLDAPPEELWKRCATDAAERPLRRDLEQFSDLYSQRLPYYRQAKVVLQTAGKDVPAICAEIEAKLQLRSAVGDPAPANRGTGESR